eukprot:jgi/Phyca11/535506/estExt2_fgenesh1_pg.C_PHYCAscaffold_370049
MSEHSPLLANGDEHSYSGVSNDDRFYMGVDKRSLLDTGESGLSTVEASRRLKIFGPNELETKEKSPWVKLAEQFWGPMPIMIWLAILVEAITKDWPDFFVLLFLQLLNGTVGWYEELKAGNAVAALKASLKPEAQVIRDGVHQTINAALLVPGDRITLSAGSAVPADCDLCEGNPVQIDQAALTGESFPVTMAHGDNAKMGSTVVRGEVEAVVSATGGQTFFGKTASLISSVDEVSHFQKILIRITMFLMAISFVLVGFCLGYLIYNGEDFLEAIAFCVVLLVASIPIAMQVVCTSTMALGSRKLAEEKVIVTQLQSIETLSGMNMLCSDKTGTLTRNKMELQDDLPIFHPTATREEVLVTAALAAKWKEPPKDALDTLVLNAIDLRPLDQYTMMDHMPFDPSVKRTESTIRGPDGKVFKVTKGAPQIILALAHNVTEIQEDVEAKHFVPRVGECPYNNNESTEAVDPYFKLPNGMLAYFGLGDLPYDQVMMMMYLKISLSDFMTVFTARTDGLFFTRAPGRLLAIAACFATIVSTLLAVFWPFTEMQAISFKLAAFVWIYCSGWFLIQDLGKVLLIFLLEHVDHMNVFERKVSSKKYVKQEAQRQNRIRMGSTLLNNDSFMRGSFVAGRPVGGSFVERSMTLEQAMDRLVRLEAEMKAIRAVIQNASGTTKV